MIFFGYDGTFFVIAGHIMSSKKGRNPEKAKLTDSIVIKIGTNPLGKSPPSAVKLDSIGAASPP